MRINKYLAHQNICSRREADRLITEGKVLINGKQAKLGDQVTPQDQVAIKGYHKDYLYLAYYKPRGIITHSPQRDEQAIPDIATLPAGVFPLGRLDKDSEGLILLTNDGRLTKKILDPAAEIEKEYIVGLNKAVTQRLIQKLIHGVTLDDGYQTKPCQVKKVDDYTLRMILTEGKNRQIRRMAEACGYHVTDLIRIRIGSIELGNLKPNQWKKLPSLI